MSESGTGGSDAGDRGDDAAVLRERGVPAAQRVVDLVQLEAALREAYCLRPVGIDAVLVPGEIPGDRDDDLAVDARERNDADARLTEGAPQARRGASEVARVEGVDRLDDGKLDVAGTAQSWLASDSFGIRSGFPAPSGGPRMRCGRLATTSAV